MESTKAKRRGRPPLYDEALSRREILVERSVDDDAIQIADKTGASLSEVYRDWITMGRAAARRPRK